jgi:hypothetical protein
MVYNSPGCKKKNPGDVNTSKHAIYLTFTPLWTCLCTFNKEFFIYIPKSSSYNFLLSQDWFNTKFLEKY